MRKLLIFLVLLSCNTNKDNDNMVRPEDVLPITIHIEVKYEDNTIDTLTTVYRDLGDDILVGRPKAYLNDSGCLEVGYRSLMMSSMSNLACDVRSFRALYLITKNNDTIR